MPTVRHNPAAIVVATLAYDCLGAVWFTALQRPWLTGTGRTLADLKATGVPPWVGYVVALAMTAILAFALSWIIQSTGSQTAARGASVAAAAWFGFIFTTWATEYAFEARGLRILAINTGYSLVGMLSMGLILGGWRAKPRFV